MTKPPEPTEDVEAENARLRARVAELERSQVGRGVAESIAENVADNVMLLDRDMTIRYINWTVPDLSREQVIGTKVFNYVPPEFRDVQRRCFERVAKNRAPDRYETNYVAADGQVSNWESRVAPIVEHGEVVGFTQISSDVTERREAAADRDRIFNLSVDMLAIAGLDGYFKRINPAFESTLGYEPEELLSRPFLEFVHPEDREPTANALDQLRDGHAVLGFENRYKHRDGSYRTLSWQAVAEPDRGIVYAVGRDVTDRRALEAELRRSQTMEAIGRLAGGLAHDFNNLVMTLSANANLAQREEDASVRAEYLDAVANAADRATALTRELLALGQREPLRLSPVDVAQLLNAVMTLARQVIPRGISVDVDVPPSLPPLRVDRARLERVLLNLVINARDAMEKEGALSVSARLVRVDEAFRRAHAWATRDAYARITVSDTGPGIPSHLRERVFEPFFTTKGEGGGTGLGLATAYAIVEGHGGTIRIESPNRMGTHVEVYLPIASEVSTVGSEQSAVVEGATILIADDEASVRDIVRKVLEGAGFRVLVTRDGVEAIAAFLEHAADIELLLFDVVMPKCDGPTALSKIREQHPHVPAILMSGYSEGAVQLATEVPMLAKPFTPAALVEAVRERLGGRRAAH